MNYMQLVGLLRKISLMMQIYSDVTNRENRISALAQTPALGSAMFGAVVAGKEKGGYNSIVEAAKHMCKVKEEYYKPNKKNVEIYGKLYVEYNIHMITSGEAQMM